MSQLVIDLNEVDGCYWLQIIVLNSSYRYHCQEEENKWYKTHFAKLTFSLVALHLDSHVNSAAAAGPSQWRLSGNEGSIRKCQWSGRILSKWRRFLSRPIGGVQRSDLSSAHQSPPRVRTEIWWQRWRRQQKWSVRWIWQWQSRWHADEWWLGKRRSISRWLPAQDGAWSKTNNILVQQLSSSLSWWHNHNEDDHSCWPTQWWLDSALVCE